jgi:chemotaxis response regulator CheB
MKLSGAETLVQDRESATVFSMPQEAIKLDAVKYVLPPSGIADFLIGLNARLKQPVRPSA